MPLETGSTIGDYKILGPLGSGGMGQVYRVQNLISNRTEAMKLLLGDLDAHADQLQRFLREIQLQASLIHPNIASLYSAARIDKRLVMFMELVEGETLSSRLAGGPLPPAVALNYAQQVLSALAYAHERGVVHRDIKPSNIMLTAEGTAKLLDFGLAAGETQTRLTRDGQILGSLYYMSPEQVRGEAPTRASDIYSMGLTLYEMLTGRRGIQGKTEFELMTAQLQTMPEPPTRVNPDIPEALSAIVLKAVAKAPGARFGSAKEFKAALEQHQHARIAEASSRAIEVPVASPARAAPAVEGARPVQAIAIVPDAPMVQGSPSAPVVQPSHIQLAAALASSLGDPLRAEPIARRAPVSQTPSAPAGDAASAAVTLPTATMQANQAAAPPIVAPPAEVPLPAPVPLLHGGPQSSQVPSAVSGPRNKSSLFAIGGAITGVAAVILGGVMVYRQGQPPSPQDSPAAAASPVTSAPPPAAPSPPVSEERTPPRKAVPVEPPAPPAKSVSAATPPQGKPAEPVTPAKSAPAPVSAPAVAVGPLPSPATPTTTPVAAPTQPTPTQITPAPPPPAAKTLQQQQAEDWARIQDSRDPAEIRAFLTKYPNGFFTAQATSRMADLEWVTLSAGATPAALRAFAARYPSSAHAPDALAAAAHLDVQRDVSAALTRFEEAFATRDLKKVRAVWPTAGAETIGRVSDLFKKSRTVALTLQPQGDVRAGASEAEVVCRESLSFLDGSKPRQVDGTVVVRLARVAEGWVIDGVTTRGTPSLYQPF